MPLTATNICRLCCCIKREGVNFVNIFGGEGLQCLLLHKINNVLQVAVTENDGLGKLVCVPCLSRLDFICNYREECLKRQKFLYKKNTQLADNGEVVSSVQNHRSLTRHCDVECCLCFTIHPKGIPFVAIFSNKGNKLMLWHKINNVLQVEVSRNVDIAQAVCYLCLGKLDMTYVFREECLSNQYALRRRAAEELSFADIKSTFQHTAVEQTNECYTVKHEFLDIADNQNDAEASKSSETADGQIDVKDCKSAIVAVDQNGLENGKHGVMADDQHIAEANKSAVVVDSVKVEEPDDDGATRSAEDVIQYLQTELEREDMVPGHNITPQGEELVAGLHDTNSPTAVGTNESVIQAPFSLFEPTGFLSDPSKSATWRKLLMESTTAESRKISGNTQRLSLTCEYCDEAFSCEADKQAHLDPPRKNGSQPCYLCSKPFLTLCAMYYHAAMEHGRKTLYRCDFCKMKFLEFGDFEFHKFKMHSKKDLLKCDKCQWYGENSTHLQVHNHVKHAVYSDTRCPTCFKVSQDHRSLLKHAKDVHNDVFVCKECNLSLKTPPAYFGHMCMHKQVKLFECPNCDKVLYTKDALHCHFKTHHVTQEMYNCVECDKQFATKRSLARHCNTTHFNEGSRNVDAYYDCDHCEKRCFSRSFIQRHLRKHSYVPKIMPCVECKICKKKCCSKYTLKIHMMMIHNKDTTYFCKICNKDFVGYSHKKVHSRVICEICGKSVRKFSLPEHEAKHNNQRNELCTICGKSFFRKSTLALHMFSHGEKKFVCKMCRNGFNRKDNMKKHSLNCKGIVQVKMDGDSSSEDP